MKRLLLAAALAGAAIAAPTYAAAKDWSSKDWYVGGSVGYLLQQDSDNAGATGAFATGNGAPGVADGTAIAAGTPYGWTTEFDEGYTVSAETGFRKESGLRSGLEVVYSKADVDRHSGVTLGGTNIDGVDAAVLTGSSTQLGSTVGEVVADGRGEITNLALFANAYYDFDLGVGVRPYVGAGIGVAKVDVEYSPSGVGIIDGDETKFAYQAKAGASWAVTPGWEVYGEYAYRATEDIDLQNDLFPGSLSIENEQHAVSLGARYRFTAN
jgi:opacity protein-like surface antigen